MQTVQLSPLKAWRLRKGLSASKLALMAHVSAQVVYASECGDRMTIHPDVLQIVEQVDGLPISKRLANEYLAWRKAQGEEVLRELTSAVAER